MIEIPHSINEKIDAAVGGDGSVMGVLFEWFRPRLYSHALRICGNKPIAQDAVQDTFISAFTHISALRNSRSFYPWLKKILVNNCYRQLLHERSDELNENHFNGDSIIHNSIERNFEDAANKQHIYNAMRFLSDDLRSCILLRYFSEVNSYAEIAVLLGIPIGTVRSRLAAAREKLQEKFFSMIDSNDAALNESNQWSGFYLHQWNNLHNDLRTRNEFYNHLHPKLRIRFTSGMEGIGRKLIEGEINDDLYYGSRVSIKSVSTSGNISVIEADNINSIEYPDRCAPSMALILFRENDRVHTAHVFDSPRP